MPHLQTKRLIIRDPLSTDFDSWHRLMSDPTTMYYLQDIMTHSEEESRQNLDIAIAESKSPNRTKYFLAIEHKQTGDFIGTIGYTVTKSTPLGKHVGLGYFILPKHQNQGYTTEALNEVIRFAFEDGGVFKIETGCLADNKASERVMQKCGFIKEADRKHHEWHDGQMKDRVEYRLLKDEWMTSKNNKNANFWNMLDELVSNSKIKIDRPKDSAHPRYPSYIYPLDYGYLENTSSMDGGGIDLWLGSDQSKNLDAIMCIVDLHKRDSEIKLLIGCTEEEKAKVYKTHNETKCMKGIMLRRE